MNNNVDPKDTALTPEVTEQAELLPPWSPCQDTVTVNEKFTVETKIEVEDVKAQCFGDAVIKPFIPFPPHLSTCKLVICQDVKVRIPIKLTTSLSADKRDVTCDKIPCPCPPGMPC